MIPHDQSYLLTVKNEWYRIIVHDFFERELQIDGEDITSKYLQITNNKLRIAKITAKQEGIFAGQEEGEYFFKTFFPHISQQWHKKDGEIFQKGEVLLTIEGNLKDLLKLERPLLNFLMRLSGIASETYKISYLVKPMYISATRKTLWGPIDKKAVSIGGGFTHRLGLFDAILIKENHLSAIGGIDQLQMIGLQTNPITTESEAEKNIQYFSPAFFEIEVETKEEFFKAYNLFFQFQIKKKEEKPIPLVIMFDNFAAEEIKETLQQFDRHISREKNIFFEASGGITNKNILEYAKTGVDVLSMGYLTHTSKPVDLSMKIELSLS